METFHPDHNKDTVVSLNFLAILLSTYDDANVFIADRKRSIAAWSHVNPRTVLGT